MTTTTTATMIVAEESLADGVTGITPIGDDPSHTMEDLRRCGGVALIWPQSHNRSDRNALGAARAVGADVIVLPCELHAARWIVATAGAWNQDGANEITRRIEALTSLAVVTRMKSCDALPAAGERSVAYRWAGRAWRPCRWCRGGGIRMGACARCRAPITGEN